jgi:hypothetical protein
MEDQEAMAVAPVRVLEEMEQVKVLQAAYTATAVMSTSSIALLRKILQGVVQG